VRVQCEFNRAHFANQLKKLQAASGASMREILRSRGGIFARDGMKSTPPFGERPLQEPLAIQESIGKQAILQDLIGGRRYSWANPKAGIFLVLSDANRAKVAVNRTGVVRLFARKDGTVYGVDRQYWRPDASLAEMREHHARFRSKRTGRVTSAGARTRDVGRWKFIDKLVVSKPSFRALLQYLWGHVGMGKAGWVKALKATRGRKHGAPRWVTRHTRGVASGIYQEAGTHDKPVIVIGNGVPHIQRFALHVERTAWKSQLRNLDRQVKRQEAEIVRGNLRRMGLIK
jgi:hypothetical protein